MLTPDMVRVRRKGNELQLSALTGKARTRALELAESYLALVRAHLGASYEQLKEAWNGVDVGPRDKKLALGLQKLIEDAAELGVETAIDPRTLRSQVFLHAAERRSANPRGFDRAEVLRQVGEQLTNSDDRTKARAESPAPSLDDLDAALFADLKSQHRIQRVPAFTPDALVERYDLSQYQAVLLRAARVTVHLECNHPTTYRHIFRALKFRRLLCTISQENKGYRLDIDGPFSLFESVTKYGLQLALLFPVLLQCDRVQLDADLRWGKTRTPLTLRYEFTRPRRAETELAPIDSLDSLPQEIQDLIPRLQQLDPPWTIAPNTDILDLPGVGVIIPDLVFTRGKQVVYFELLGFWSRQAVWKRIELIERGLPHKLLFGVSTRLRVSEALLDQQDHAALYVFKGTLNPKQILTRIDQLAG